MRKFNNNKTIFWGLSFIAFILIEAFSIIMMKDRPYISTSVGVLVLITGYLFMRSARNAINTGSKDALLYMEQIFKEGREDWQNRYNELEKLQKATYTATKKSTAILTEQNKAFLSRLESLEGNFNKAWQMIIELQKKSLDGQKKALNIEINHMKDNMKHLEKIIREENSLEDIHKNIEYILYQLNNVKINDAPESDYSISNEPDSEAEDYKISDNKVSITPIYDNPNQNLTPEEIASLFASIEK